MTNEDISRIVDTYSDLIMRICFTYLKNTSESEDICQEVFLKMLRLDKNFESPEHEKRWIIRAASNACKDNLKSFFKRNVHSMDQILKNEGDTFPVNSGDMDWETMRTVRNCVQRLPEKYRIVIYLFYYEGYNAAEIGQILGLPQNTIFTRLKRGRELLRMDLRQDFGGLDDEK